jgi:hypothetical protein
MDRRKIKISKLEAARRQVETAIRIYFANGDPVSIHTLAAASLQILVDLDKKALFGTSSKRKLNRNTSVK